MTRTAIDLGADPTILDAADRLAAAPPDGDIALVVPPGAPLLRSGVFLEVLRAQAGPRRLSLVTTDARARSLASSVHVPAYASVAALERRELDPTERLEPARRAAIAGVRPRTARPRGASLRRIAGVAGSLAASLLVLAAVVLPQAKVTAAAAAQPLGPLDLVVRAGSGGEVAAKTLSAPVSAKVSGTAGGARIEDVRAKGSVQLENKTTDDVRVPKGSVFKTAEGTQFLSTADATVPRSVILPPAFTVIVGKTSVPIEAAVAGPGGNVAKGRITVGPTDRYTVTNPEPTSGGDSKRIPIVRLEDYDTAVKRAPDALRAAAEEQLARWTREPRSGEQVVQQVLARQTSLAPANVDVVGKEVASFDLSVSGIATAYVVADSEPKKAILSKLREAVAAGNEIDERGVEFDVKALKVGEDGVTWNVSARGQQIRRTDPARIGRVLAGRPVRDTQSALAAEGLQLVRLDWVPAWWPLMPLLDARITVQVEAPPARAGP